jgi:TolB-like protein
LQDDALTGAERHEIESVPERILASDDFDASARNRYFLRFIVGETLAFSSDRIKAYTIATDVFGRHPSFDPRTDPIVRIEAKCLGRSLERYYPMAGRAERIVISVPKGGNVPAFRAAAPAAVAAPPARLPEALPRPARTSRLPTISVADFEVEHAGGGDGRCGAAFTRKVTVPLARFTTVAVLVHASPERAGRNAEAGSGEAAHYRLAGGISVEPGRFTVGVLPVETDTGRCVWSEFYERLRTFRSAGEASDEVASTSARTVAQPYGILSSEGIRAALRAPLGTLTA